MGLKQNATVLFYVSPVPANKMRIFFFIYSITPYIHPRLDSRIES